MKLNSVVNMVKKDTMLTKRKLDSRFKGFQEKFHNLCADVERFKFIEFEVANNILSKARTSGVESKLNSSLVNQFSINQQCGIKIETKIKSIECLIVVPIDSNVFGGVILETDILTKFFWELSDLLDDDFIIFEPSLNSSIKVLVDRTSREITNGDIFVKGSNLNLTIE